jgi:polyisoprenoid-binding protein YceI
MYIQPLKKRVVWIVSILAVMVLLAACQSAEPEPASVTTEAPVAATEAPAEASSEDTSQPAVDTPTPAPEAAVETSSQQAAPATAGVKIFQIVQDGSEARFTLDEQLMGQPKTVIGVTSLVQGEISVDPTDPASAQIGVLQIDARDLTTDSDRRNGAIRRWILQSDQDQYRYITFEPTSIEGLPETVTIGEPFTFSVAGNLKIRDLVHPETFQMTVTANSEDELVGLGSTTVLRENYQLTIPSVPSVANVSEEVKLEIEFTARSAQ